MEDSVELPPTLSRHNILQNYQPSGKYAEKMELKKRTE